MQVRGHKEGSRASNEPQDGRRSHHTGSVGVRGSSPLSSTRVTWAFTLWVRALVSLGCRFLRLLALGLLLDLRSRLRNSPERCSHLVGSLLRQRRRLVAVGVSRDAHGREPEQVHDHSWVNALGEQQGRGGVPAVVQSDAPYLRGSARASPRTGRRCGRPWGRRPPVRAAGLLHPHPHVAVPTPVSVFVDRRLAVGCSFQGPPPVALTRQDAAQASRMWGSATVVDNAHGRR
jgi:hypothetical protein